MASYIATLTATMTGKTIAMIREPIKRHRQVDINTINYQFGPPKPFPSTTYGSTAGSVPGGHGSRSYASAVTKNFIPPSPAPTTASTTQVSGITESQVSDAIDESLKILQQSHKLDMDAFNLRIQKLEDDIASITSTVDTMAGAITQKVVACLTALTGIISIQSSKIDKIGSSLEALSAAVTKLLEQSLKPSSPRHKKSKTDSADDNPMQENDAQME